MKINNIQGELTDISAKKEALVVTKPNTVLSDMLELETHSVVTDRQTLR